MVTKTAKPKKEKRPVTPWGPATSAARALVRTATAAAKACEEHYWGTPRWEAVLEALRAVGRGVFRAVGAPVAASEGKPARTLAWKWGLLEGYADGAGPRAVVSEGRAAFFALRAAAGLDLKRRRTYPLDAWYAALCAREGRPYTAPPSTAAALDADQLRGVFSERTLQLLTARTLCGLSRAWDVVLDDAWDAESLAALELGRSQREGELRDPLRTRIEKSADARTLARAWARASKMGRTNELAELHLAARARLGLDTQAAQIAA